MAGTDAIDEAAKVDFLSRGDSYPTPGGKVLVIETHLSWVFLTETFAYKFKKPVHREFLDFSTLHARHRNCEEELRLNRRLAPDVYLGVIPLVKTLAGSLSVGGIGVPVEWLVKMRRLPHEHMLDTAIRRGTADPAHLRQLALLLAEFYRKALPGNLSGAAYRAQLAHALRSHLAILSEERYQLDSPQLQAVAQALFGYLESAALVFEQRATQRLVEGHGDLRPEHICLRPEPLVIDCLEFNRALRVLDPIDELAYLGLECEKAGAEGIGATVIAVYRDVTGDHPPSQLTAFYSAMRALLRAKLCAWHLTDRPNTEHPRWLAAAASYLKLAVNHAARLDYHGGASSRSVSDPLR